MTVDMGEVNQQIVNSWILSLREGEVFKLLNDISFVGNLQSESNGNLGLKFLCVLSSVIYKMKHSPNENITLKATVEETFKLGDLCCSSCCKVQSSLTENEKYIVALHHVIDYFFREECYDSALKLKGYINTAGFRDELQVGNSKILSVLNNLYLMFWNGSIVFEKSGGHPDLVLNLRHAAIDLMCCAGRCALSTVAERITATSRKYIVHMKEESSKQNIINMLSDLLVIITQMADKLLKSICEEIESSENSIREKDWYSQVFKPFSEILAEIMRVHNLSNRGNEGLELCTKNCEQLSGSDNPRRHFCEFLSILLDVFAQMAVTSSSCDNEKGFHGIHSKLCLIEDPGEGLIRNEIEGNFAGINFKSASFLNATECICQVIVDVWGKQNEAIFSSLDKRDKNSLLLLIKLGADLNLALDNELATSLKFNACSIKIITQLLSEDLENEDTPNKLKEIEKLLRVCLEVEKKADCDQSFKWKVAMGVLFQCMYGAMEVLAKREFYELYETFTREYLQLVFKWNKCPEFAHLMNNVWLDLKNLCICCREQKKFRPALTALATAIHLDVSVERSLIFKEWGKVKMKAKLFEQDDQLKKSTIYHILKENVEEEKWNFTSEDMSQLLRYELYAYKSVELNLKAAIEDACLVVLEMSSDVILKAEAQLYLVECSFSQLGLVKVPAGSDISEEDELEKKEAGLRAAVKSCEKIAIELKEEFNLRKSSSSKGMAVIICLLAQAYYWLFLCLYSIKLEKSKIETVPLRAPKKEEEGDDQRQSGGGDAPSCDVVPSQWSLKSSKQSHLLSSSLNVAVVLWERALKKGLEFSDQETFNAGVTLKCIETTARVYELFDDSWHYVISWSLLCKYADIFKNNDFYLLGVSNLVRSDAISLNSSCSLKIVEMSKNCKEKSSLLYEYLLGQSWRHLFASEYSEGLVYLKRVLSECNQHRSCVHSVLYAQAKYLLAIYCIQSPPDSTELESTEDPVFAGSSPRDSAVSGLGVLIRLLNNFSEIDSLPTYFFAQTLLLEISMWLGELFLKLDTPREGYAYLKEQFLVAQKLLLPNRTVQFLSILALLDDMCLNIRDCEVKFLGMVRILDVEFKDKKKSVEVTEENLCEGMKGMIVGKEATAKKRLPIKPEPKKFLTPVAKCGRNRIFDSPEVEEDRERKRVPSPEILNHSDEFIRLQDCEDECVCEWCMDGGYLRAYLGMVLVKVHKLCITHERQSMALNNMFNIADKLMRDIVNRHRKLMKKIRSSSYSILPVELTSNDPLAKVSSESSSVEEDILEIFHVSLVLKRVDSCLKLWEISDGANKDMLGECETLMDLIDEDFKGVKSLYGKSFLVGHVMMKKLIISLAKNCIFHDQNKDIDECMEEEQSFDFLKAGSNKADVLNTPTRENTGTPSRRTADGVELNEKEENYDPIPVIPRRNVPRWNLNALLEEEEVVDKKNKAKRGAIPKVAKTKPVTSTSKSVPSLNFFQPVVKKAEVSRKEKVTAQKTTRKVAAKVVAPFDVYVGSSASEAPGEPPANKAAPPKSGVKPSSTTMARTLRKPPPPRQLRTTARKPK